MKAKRKGITNRVGGLATLIVPILMLVSGREARAQTFNSGSTGADGALDLSAVPSGTTVNFEPGSLKTYLNRDINWDDNRFDFTTITIPSGVTVKLSARWSSGPVYWLANGAVQIYGIVDVSGENGIAGGNSLTLRTPAIPGPGGFPGGVGGNSTLGGTRSAQPGAGPLGGLGAPNAPNPVCGLGGAFSGNKYLVPLVGGSGGGGSDYYSYTGYEYGGNGGAGGGSILIASSVSITISGPGQIYAWGGDGGRYSGGGGGGGGAIRLAAPIVQGGGAYLYVQGGASGGCGLAPYTGGYGQVRIDAFTHSWTYNITGPFTRGSPLSSYVPSGPPPTIAVFAISTVVNSQTVPVFIPQFPTGSFDIADATINTTSNVTFDIRARGVPANTAVDLYIQSLEGPDVHLTGTLSTFDDSSHTYTASATVSTPLPSGFSRGYVRAKW